MHYLNQYLRVYGVESDPTLPFNRSAAACADLLIRKNLAYLEHLILKVAIFGLVLKVIYQDYVLEHLPLQE